MKYEIDTHFVDEWIKSLDKKSMGSLYLALEQLSEKGPNLKRPLVGIIKGSDFPNMKELRPPSSGRAEIRVLFIFDKIRNAVLLLGGDKSCGKFKWEKWYNKMIPIADARYRQHEKELEEQLKREKKG